MDWLPNLVNPRKSRSRLGSAGRIRSQAGRQRGAGVVSHRARRPALRHRSSRTRPPAGNRPGQQHVLNFSKGCYVGQEIVERIRSRGNVHRMFVGIRNLQGGAPDCRRQNPGADEEVGEITSAARLPFASGERTLALGYIRRRVRRAGTEVKIEPTRKCRCKRSAVLNRAQSPRLVVNIWNRQRRLCIRRCGITGHEYQVPLIPGPSRATQTASPSGQQPRAESPY